MSGTAQKPVSPSIGPSGSRESPASEPVSDHSRRLSPRELTGVCFPYPKCPPSDTDLFWEPNSEREVGSSKTKGLC